LKYREATLEPEADRSILVVGIGGRVIALDRATGTTRWSTRLVPGDDAEVYVALRYGVLAVSAFRARIFVLDYQTGEPRWTAQTSSSGRATIVIEPDLIVCAKGGEIDCWDHEGRHLWTRGVPDETPSRAALAFPGNVAQADAGRE
jgi:outer membrane protein assembly factor BamB